MTISKTVLTQSILELFTDNDRLLARNKELEAQLYGKTELWCVKLISLDRMLAMRSLEVAEVRALELNTMGAHGPIAEVVPSPWPLDVHLNNCLQVTEAWLQEANDQMALLRQSLSTLSAFGNP